jgi:hypothetical protein
MGIFVEKTKDDFIFAIQTTLDTLCQSNYLKRIDVEPGKDPIWMDGDTKYEIFDACAYLERLITDRQLADSFENTSDAISELGDLKYLQDTKIKYLAQRIIEKF